MAIPPAGTADPWIIVKIGVAFSGCDIGGLGAYEVLRALEEHGLEIGMVSACGLPSVTSLLYALGWGGAACRELGEKFLRNAREIDLDMAVAEFAAETPLHRLETKIPYVMSSACVSDGRICAFTNLRRAATDRLLTFPLEDAYDALSATISPVEGLASYEYEGCRLCDFAVWYGSPVYPLKMAALDRVLAVSFLPRSPQTPYEALVKQRITASSKLADLHIPIEPERADYAGYIDQAAEAVRERIEEICMKVLF